MSKVKNTRLKATRLSSKNQVTIPVGAVREAGLEPGDRLVVHVDGPGRVVLERVEDVLAKYSGIFTGLYGPDELETLRNEWD